MYVHTCKVNRQFTNGSTVCSSNKTYCLWFTAHASLELYGSNTGGAPHSLTKLHAKLSPFLAPFHIHETNSYCFVRQPRQYLKINIRRAEIFGNNFYF